MNPAKVRQLLKRGEWQGKVRDEWSGMNKDSCPWCDGLRGEGHEPGCVLVAALNEIDSCSECNGSGVVERSIRDECRTVGR